MTNHSETAIHMGRKHIANLAEADGQTIFAREVLGGCWDHRRDVAAAIDDAQAKIKAMDQDEYDHEASCMGRSV